MSSVALTPSEESASREALPEPLRAALDRVPELVTVLRGFKKARYFGCHRLQFVELIGALAQTRYAAVYRVLVESKAFSVLLDIFFERIWLNFAVEWPPKF